ncbi:penicillin-binding transpeptidase domain-containing protein [Streptomyces thermolineatus]|uniref:Penicillin-binding transpeptidase domain-containing protein n=1 Tax=Streptomyces thermolineatus TaxID=44033 RepID=A0ABP5YML6_9ACTN
MRHHGIPAAVTAAALVAAFMTGCGAQEDGPDAVVRGFLDAWAAGDEAAAAGFTDEPAQTRAQLARLERELDITSARFDPQDPQGDEDGPTVLVPFRASLGLRGAGTWTYGSSARVHKGEDGWRIRFERTLLHPGLGPRDHLVRKRLTPPRAGVLAADGSDLAPRSTVWAVSIWPAKLTDPDRAYAALGDPALGADIDTGALRKRVEAADPDRSVPVVTLRDGVYRSVRDTLTAVPGLQFRDFTRPLAAAARPLVGSVQPATAETLENAGRHAAPTDEVGATGLQYRYQKQLAGTPGASVVVVDEATKEAGRTVYEHRPRAGAAVRTTLDPEVQKAAEAALSGFDGNASLVALRSATGEVLAVADTPADGGNRALTGRYAPGSTFKAVTAAALLDAGVSPDTDAPCPRTVTVNGQRFENQAEFELPTGTTFREDFAHSCNTGFIGMRDRLPAGALTAAAAKFGIGGPWQVGAAGFDGSVPEPSGPNDEAAAMIGQGRVEASPLVMASVAATVESGRFHQPVLVPAAVKEKHRAPGPGAAVAKRLRELMRAVVTDGSGRALKDLPGAPAAKTGTAEYGDADPPRTHAWIIGFRDGVAFSVLLEDGGSGGKDAGPVAARFLRALD